MTVNPESSDLAAHWPADTVFAADQMFLGLAKPPEGEPNAMVVGMEMDHPIFKMLGQGPLQISFEMDLEAAERIYGQFGECLMLLRVALAAREAGG